MFVLKQRRNTDVTSSTVLTENTINDEDLAVLSRSKNEDLLVPRLFMKENRLFREPFQRQRELQEAEGRTKGVVRMLPHQAHCIDGRRVLKTVQVISHQSPDRHTAIPFGLATLGLFR